MARDRNQSVPETENGSSPDRVVEWVEEGLHSGRYVPGQKLIEAELIATLGVSRGPVREGLKRLHGRGVVTQTPHRGAHIRAFSRPEAQDLLTVLEPLTSLMAQLAATAVAEGAAARPLADIDTWIKRFRQGDFNDMSFVGKRQHFYESLIAIGGNRELPLIMPISLLHLLRLQSFRYLDSRNRQDVVDEYLKIIDAVMAGDATRAAKLGKAHVQAAKKRLASLPDHAFPGSHFAGA